MAGVQNKINGAGNPNSLQSQIDNEAADSGATNFRLPDLRGRFLRGLDASPTQGESGRDPYRNSRSQNASGGNAGNTVGSLQADSTRLPR